MFTPSIQIDLDLWEAWIEFDHLSSDSFGHLYILGEIIGGRQRKKPRLVKRSSEGGKLVLSLEMDDTTEGSRMIEVVYDELISNLNSYSSVLIYKKDELIAEINEIDVLI